MGNFAVNPNPKYHNFKGQLPHVKVEPAGAEKPEPGPGTHPKVITDTTLRDGAQDPRFAIFPGEARVKYFDLLHKLDNGTGRIEAVEVFIYQKRDLWTLERLLDRGYKYPQVTTWTRALPKDIKLLADISKGRIKETGILASASDHHIFDKLGFHSKEEAMHKYLVPIMAACELGIKPRVHLEDVTKADIEGFVIPFISLVLKETKGTATFRLCDTLGIGVPDPYSASPFGIPKLVSTILRATGAELEFHGHNDFGCATANSIAALQYGCRKVNTAFAGMGERTGNTPLEQVLCYYVRLYGNPGFQMDVLQEMADLINREVAPIPEKQPIVGSSIFTTQAGLHQTGMERQKDAPGGLIYLPFDPFLIGRQSIESNRIGSLSGMDGLVAILNQEMERATGEKQKFSLFSKSVKRLYDHIQEAYDGNYDEAEGRYSGYRVTFFGPGELLEIVRKE